MEWSTNGIPRKDHSIEAIQIIFMLHWAIIKTAIPPVGAFYGSRLSKAPIAGMKVSISDTMEINYSFFLQL